MLKRTLLGFAAIAASTSCVPPSSRLAGTVAPAPVRDAEDARSLLASLSLKAPTEPLERAFADPLAAVSPIRAAAPAFDGAARTDDDRQRAIACLTAAVYYEARSESADGQRAVAQVVLNRVRDRAFPHSVCGVVYQGSARRTGCQFSFTCDGSMRHPLDPSAWARATAIAQAAYAGAVYAPVGAATSYHATSVLPWWASSLTRIGLVGAHVFYRWRGAMERALTFRQDYAGLEPDRATRAGTGDAAMADATGQTTPLTAGVTVHRGNAVADTPTVSSSPSPRMMTASGVRVHFGAHHAALPAASAAALPIVEISEETDAT